MDESPIELFDVDYTTLSTLVDYFYTGISTKLLVNIKLYLNLDIFETF